MWEFEHTDTFGGEANYCWVKRERYTGRAKTNRGIVRAAKAFAGFTGMKCSVDNYGDAFAIRPVGRSAPCQIVFANWVEE